MRNRRERIDDLIFVLECLPETQVAQIFNPNPVKHNEELDESVLRKLFGAMLNMKILDWEGEKDRRLKKERILKTCHIILEFLGNLELARKLAPDQLMVILDNKERDVMVALRSIYLARPY